MTKSLLLVCDDAGYASIDRGIRHLVEETGRPVSAEFLITQPGAAESARKMKNYSLISCGLHFELSTINDEQRFRLGKTLLREGTSLGEQPEIREQAAIDARRQLEYFRDELGQDPAHISTHGNFNVDRNNRVMEWWIALMEELFEGHLPPMQLDIPIIRHNMYGWNVPDTERAPLSPAEFGDVLMKMSHHDIVEFVMHPADPHTSDASIDMLFDAHMRIADLESAIEIINAHVIEEAGFEIQSVAALR